MMKRLQLFAATHRKAADGHDDHDDDTND